MKNDFMKKSTRIMKDLLLAALRLTKNTYTFFDQVNGRKE